MIYRSDIPEDWADISAYLDGHDYFGPIDPADLGGCWVIAVDEDSRIRGTIWFFRYGRNAYVDYWAADTGQIAAGLGARLGFALTESGVKHVRANIVSHNQPAKRLANALGMNLVDGYSLAYMRL